MSIKAHDYDLHRLELRHCIALGKAYKDIADICSNPDILEANSLLLEYNTLVFNEDAYVESNDYDCDEFIKACDISFSPTICQRVGSLGPIHTHCVTWHRESNILSIDGRAQPSGSETVKVDLNDVQCDEGSFFQYNLVHKNFNDLLYIFAFAYLRQNPPVHQDALQLESNLLNILKYIPELKEQMISTGYFDDLIDLYNMIFDESLDIKFYKNDEIVKYE